MDFLSKNTCDVNVLIKFLNIFSQDINILPAVISSWMTPQSEFQMSLSTYTTPSGLFLHLSTVQVTNCYNSNKFLVAFNPLCTTFLHVGSYLLLHSPKLIRLDQATTESHHSVHSHRTLDSPYFNICSSQKALRTMYRRFRDRWKWLGRDSAQWTYKPHECYHEKKRFLILTMKL